MEDKIILSAEDAIVQEQLMMNQEALAYLEDTDWIVTRFAETNEPIPADIIVLRAEARLKIIK